MSQREPRARRRRQQGAVLVEGVIVAASFVVLLGCLFVVHRYCSLQLSMLDDARKHAWQKSMAGCGVNEPPLSPMASELKTGDGLSFPLNMIPLPFEETRSFQVTGGPFSPSGSRQMTFICNPRPTHTKPLTDMVGWLGDIFT
jgi:hypothetical protein